MQDMVIYSFNPRTQGAEAGEFKGSVRGSTQSKIQDRYSYIEKPSQITEKEFKRR